ncbi:MULTISPECIES: ATP-dependent nuclease [Alphaproteobacteria]|uniref:ATP-dependent nuclease n=1 Tax=Alphaproteobacteria TaxID=28211 RepID=UPI0032667299
MRISRINISNFANFSQLDIETGESLVIVGENKVGKSNLILALRLILDPTLSERDRYLTLDQFWDGLGEEKLGKIVEVSVEFADFDDEPRLIAHLADAIVDPGPPAVARLTYRFQPKAGLDGEPESLSDYEYIIFCGDNPDLAVPPSVRRMLPLDVLGALRDAEGDLANWRKSPLRPLIDQLASELDDQARKEIQDQANTAHDELAERTEVAAVAEKITERLQEIAGDLHTTEIALGLNPTKLEALLRSLRLMIDGGTRGLEDASLGTANLVFLTLKSLELDRSVDNLERDHTFLAVEEPEAHLHPHVQRLVYRYFLGSGDVGAQENTSLTTILTTHSPHIASVAPLKSIVHLRYNRDAKTTTGVSTVNAPLNENEVADLQRYVDVTRGELFFARGVILVEGDAERFLIPAFAKALDIDLDVLGISVCSVAGTNFAPYVKLLGPAGLHVPMVVLTDLDPVGVGKPRAHNRIRKLLEIVAEGQADTGLSTPLLLARGRDNGFFVNAHTLEIELFQSGLHSEMLEILSAELPLSAASEAKLDEWDIHPETLDFKELLKFVERVGKGRFAQLLAAEATQDNCPEYIEAALRALRDATA